MQAGSTPSSPGTHGPPLLLGHRPPAPEMAFPPGTLSTSPAQPHLPSLGSQPSPAYLLSQMAPSWKAEAGTWGAPVA